MFKALQCLHKGHRFVDSRSQANTQVCVRCRHRKPFEALTRLPAQPGKEPTSGAERRGRELGIGVY